MEEEVGGGGGHDALVKEGQLQLVESLCIGGGGGRR